MTTTLLLASMAFVSFACHSTENRTRALKSLAPIGPSIRTLTEPFTAVDFDGNRLVDMPGGRPSNQIALYDLSARRLYYLEIPPANSVVAVGISRDGKALFATIRQIAPPDVIGVRKSTISLIEIDTQAWKYKFLNSNADHFGLHLESSPDSHYLYYIRGVRDKVTGGADHQPTRYTHQFGCCTEGALLARYDLSKDREDILGPIISPQGQGMIGLQPTLKGIYFFSFGINKAPETGYDPSLPAPELAWREANLRTRFNHIYLEPHPSSIEDYSTEDAPALGEMMFRFPVGKTELGENEKVHAVRPSEVSLSSPIVWVGNSAPASFAFKPDLVSALIHNQPATLFAVRPYLSDDEKTIMFGDARWGCWGRVSAETRLSCSDFIAGGRKLSSGGWAAGGDLSHDGKKLLFLVPISIESRDPNDKNERICQLSFGQKIQQCAWLMDKSMSPKTITLTKDNHN